MPKSSNLCTPVNHRRRRLLLTSAIAGGGMFFGANAATLKFPSRPVHMILPLPPGGAADRVLRLFADHLTKKWGQSVIVESRPGGGMVVGTLALAKAPPDGHTIGMISSSMSVNHVLRDDLPYDALQDLEPLARIGYYTMAIIAKADFPANNVAELIALAKDKKGTLACGSNGIGTTTEVALNLFNQMADVELRHIPYNGGTKLYSDMLGDHIGLGFSIMGSADGFIRSGQLKLLGVTSINRSPLYPHVQAISEEVPDYEVISWTGLAAPAGISTEIRQILSNDILDIANLPDVSTALADMSIELSPQSGEALKRSIQTEVKTISAIAARSAS